MRAERQLIVWGRLKPQRGIVCAGDKSWCCHSDAELNPSLFLKGLICAEWAATPQRADVLGSAILGTFATGAVWGGGSNVRAGTCCGREAGLHLRTRDPVGVPGRATQRRGRVRG